MDEIKKKLLVIFNGGEIAEEKSAMSYLRFIKNRQNLEDRYYQRKTEINKKLEMQTREKNISEELRTS